MKHLRHMPAYSMTRYAILIAAFLLTACATTNETSHYALENNDKGGLLIVSLSHEGLRAGENPTWSYRGIGSQETKTLIPGTLITPLDWGTPPGKLIYVALPPGKYEFYRCGLTRTTGGVPSWHIGAGGIPTNNNPYYAGFDAARYPTGSVNAEPFSIPFDITAGQATYLGNLHFVWSDSAQQGRVTTLDHTERDLALLRERLPRIQPSQLRRSRMGQ